MSPVSLTPSEPLQPATGAFHDWGCRALSGHLSKRAQREEDAAADDEASDATGPTEADAVAAAALEVVAKETPAEQAAARVKTRVSWGPNEFNHCRSVQIRLCCST